MSNQFERNWNFSQLARRLTTIGCEDEGDIKSMGITKRRAILVTIVACACRFDAYARVSEAIFEKLTVETLAEVRLQAVSKARSKSNDRDLEQYYWLRPIIDL